MVTQFQLEEALRSMGVAEVLVGDPTVVGGMVSLGATEGEIRVEITEGSNALTAPELTGGIPHQATTTLDSATIVVPLVLGDPALWARVSATGTKGGGYSTPQPVQETSVLVIPRNELGAGLSYGGGPPKVWAPRAPENAVWLWRAYAQRGAVPFRYADGGKVIVEVRFVGMFDASKPEGQKVYTIGDPAAQGITEIVL